MSDINFVLISHIRRHNSNIINKFVILCAESRPVITTVKGLYVSKLITILLFVLLLVIYPIHNKNLQLRMSNINSKFSVYINYIFYTISLYFISSDLASYIYHSPHRLVYCSYNAFA